MRIALQPYTTQLIDRRVCLGAMIALSGVPGSPLPARGTGAPYLVGLISREDIVRGQIEHAIALGVSNIAARAVWAAVASEGTGPAPPGLPAGARVQLDPGAGTEEFEKWGLTGIGKVIARAMQRYGLIVVGKANAASVYVEHEETARWNGTLVESTVSAIPPSALKVLEFE